MTAARPRRPALGGLGGLGRLDVEVDRVIRPFSAQLQRLITISGAGAPEAVIAEVGGHTPVRQRRAARVLGRGCLRVTEPGRLRSERIDHIEVDPGEQAIPGCAATRHGRRPGVPPGLQRTGAGRAAQHPIGEFGPDPTGVRRRRSSVRAGGTAHERGLPGPRRPGGQMVWTTLRRPERAGRLARVGPTVTMTTSGEELACPMWGQPVDRHAGGADERRRDRSPVVTLNSGNRAPGQHARRRSIERSASGRRATSNGAIFEHMFE